MDETILDKFVEDLHFSLMYIKIDAQHGVVPAEWVKCLDSVENVIKATHKKYKGGE